MAKLGQSILVGIPTTSSARMSVQWIESATNLQMPLGSAWGRKWIIDRHIAEARNLLVDAAFETKSDYLFMLGDDVIAPLNTMTLMLAKIGLTHRVGGLLPSEIDSNGRSTVDNSRLVRADMITGIYWTKSYPAEPYIWNRPLLSGPYRNWRAGEFFPIDLAGCDCLLIDMKRMADLPRPWFRTDWIWEEGQQPSTIATEDFYFYTHARKHGFRLFADTMIECLHEDRSTGATYGLSEDAYQARGLPFTPDETEMTLAELGAGLWSPNFGAKTTVVRFDGRADIKPDVRCDLRNIPSMYFGKFDMVHASHVLEHFGRDEILDTLKHWCLLLKPDGNLVIRVPNTEFAMRRIIDAVDHPGEGRCDNYDWAQLYGSQQKDYETSYHKVGFVQITLKNALSSIPGLTNVSVTVENDGLNLIGRGTYRNLGSPKLLDMWNEIEAKEGVPPDDSTTNMVMSPNGHDTAQSMTEMTPERSNV